MFLHKQDFLTVDHLGSSIRTSKILFPSHVFNCQLFVLFWRCCSEETFVVGRCRAGVTIITARWTCRGTHYTVLDYTIPHFTALYYNGVYTLYTTLLLPLNFSSLSSLFFYSAYSMIITVPWSCLGPGPVHSVSGSRKSGFLEGSPPLPSPLSVSMSASEGVISLEALSWRFAALHQAATAC